MIEEISRELSSHQECIVGFLMDISRRQEEIYAAVLAKHSAPFEGDGKRLSPPQPDPPIQPKCPAGLTWVTPPEKFSVSSALPALNAEGLSLVDSIYFASLPSRDRSIERSGERLQNHESITTPPDKSMNSMPPTPTGSERTPMGELISPYRAKHKEGSNGYGGTHSNVTKKDSLPKEETFRSDLTTFTKEETHRSDKAISDLRKHMSHHAHSPTVKKWMATAERLHHAPDRRSVGRFSADRRSADRRSGDKPHILKARHRHSQTDAARMEAAKEAHMRSQKTNSMHELQSKSKSGQLNRCSLKALVETHAFELFFAIVIVTNSFFIGLQVEYAASQRTDTTPNTFYVIQYTYAFIFTLELGARLVAYGRVFFSFGAENVGWNYLDAFCVSTTLFEVCLDTIFLATRQAGDGGGITSSASSARIIRILRIARLMRIIRVARILRFIHALRTFIFSIVATLKSLVWALVLLFIIVYLFGILFTQAAGDWLIDESDRASSDSRSNDYGAIERYWGSLPKSMFTLYKSISGGLSWDDAVHPAAQFGWVWVGVFLLFISFTYFAVLNVVTGIFCQGAIESAQQNEDLMVQIQIASKELYVSRIRKLFADLDDDSSGSITIVELEENMNEENVQAAFASMDIDTKDAWTLFKLLAPDEGCEITAEDFVEGLMRLKGNAKRADFVELHLLVKRLDQTSHELLLMVDNMARRLVDLSSLFYQSFRGSHRESGDSIISHVLSSPIRTSIPRKFASDFVGSSPSTPRNGATYQSVSSHNNSLENALMREGFTQSTADDDRSYREYTDLLREETIDHRTSEVAWSEAATFLGPKSTKSNGSHALPFRLVI